MKLKIFLFIYTLLGLITSALAQCDFNPALNYTQWSELRKSVVAIWIPQSNGDVDVGTGVLVNNTQNDGKPYVLTVRHNFDRNDDGIFSATEIAALSNATFRFNYLTATNSESFTTKGATFLASSTGIAVNGCNDWMLIQLNEDLIANCRDVYYAGWTFNSFESDANLFILHHPGYLPMKASINTNPVQRTKISNICTDTLARISWQGNSGIGLGSSGAPIFQDTTELIGVLQSVAYSSSNQCNFRAFNGEVLFANIAGQGSSFDKNIYTALQSYLDPLKKIVTQKTWPGASPAEFRYSDHVLKRGIYRSSMKDLYLKNLITNSQASVMAGKSITIQTSSGQTSTYKAGSSFFVNNIGISSTCYTTAIYKGSENESKEIYNPDMSHIRIDIMPNPFSNKTSISCSLSERSKVQLALYDILGNKVREIYNQEMPEGETRIEFRSDNLHPGIYLARMIIDGRPAITKRIVLQP